MQNLLIYRHQKISINVIKLFSFIYNQIILNWRQFNWRFRKNKHFLERQNVFYIHPNCWWTKNHMKIQDHSVDLNSIWFKKINICINNLKILFMTCFLEHREMVKKTEKRKFSDRWMARPFPIKLQRIDRLTLREFSNRHVQYELTKWQVL